MLFKRIIAYVLLTTLGLYFGSGFTNLQSFIISTIGIVFASLFAAMFIQEGVKEYERNCINVLMGEPGERNNLNIIKKLKIARFGAIPMRAKYYFLSICVLYTFAAVASGIVSAPSQAGQTEDWSKRVTTEYRSRNYSIADEANIRFNMFIVLLAPTLIGVRFGLGDKK